MFHTSEFFTAMCEKITSQEFLKAVVIVPWAVVAVMSRQNAEALMGLLFVPADLASLVMAVLSVKVKVHESSLFLAF